jgi:TonB family protein
MGAEGSITINVLISETGSVIRTEILKGMINSFGLEKAAEDAAKQWKFSPAQKAGVPVKVWKAIEFVFRKDQ